MFLVPELDFTLSIRNAKGDDLLKLEILDSYKADELSSYCDRSFENEIIYQWWSYSKYIFNEAWLQAAEPGSSVMLPEIDCKYI